MKSAIFQILLAFCLVLFSASDSEALALKTEHFLHEAGTSGNLLACTEDYFYTYGNGNNGANSNQLISFGNWGGATTHTFTYDANGSRLTMSANGRTDTYLYDDEKRLVSLDYQTDSSAAKRGIHLYQYDHRTRRVTRNESAISGGTDTRIVFADGLSIQEHNAGAITTSPAVEYIRGNDYGGGIGGILYTLRNNTPRYNAYNYRGDVTTTTDDNASINWQAAYEAYGTRPQEAGTNPERQRANTKDEDPTGLLNEGMRYRDLLTGTFITRDPAGIVDGPNEYSYVRQNPWTMFDPDGLRSERHDAIGKDGKITGGLELHHKDFVRDSKGYSNQYRWQKGKASVGQMFQNAEYTKYPYLVRDDLKTGKRTWVIPVFKGKLGSNDANARGIILTDSEKEFKVHIRNQVRNGSAFYEISTAVVSLASGAANARLGSFVRTTLSQTPAGPTARTTSRNSRVTAARNGNGQASKKIPKNSSDYIDTTRVSSRYANRTTNVSKRIFEKNLTKSGWVRSVSKDGKTVIFQKNGAKYVLRDGAKSTGGSTADYYKPGSKGISLKIRLGK